MTQTTPPTSNRRCPLVSVDYALILHTDCIAGPTDVGMVSTAAWPIGGLLPWVTKVPGAIVVSDDHEESRVARDRFLNGIVNSEAPHNARAVDAGIGDLDFLLWACVRLGLPGAFIDSTDGTTSIRQFRSDGTPIVEGNGLEKVRMRLTSNGGPLPSAAWAKGTREQMPELAEQFQRDKER